MKDKFTNDAENLSKENSKQLQEQAKRLQNMADANLEKIKNENSQQLSLMRSTLQQKEQELKQKNAMIEAEIRRQQEAARCLQQQQQQQAASRSRRRGGMYGK